MPRYDVILASASPRRLDLLRQIGVEPVVRPTAVPEDVVPGETPAAHVRRLAEAKGRALADDLERASGLRVVLAADTVVVLNGETLGKPRDDDDARAMLRRLSGKAHEVLTGMWASRSDDGRTAGWVETSRVRFRALPDASIRWYVDTGEPRDKAGAYAIQGCAAVFVEALEGSWTNVVGLPLERVPALLERIGLDLEDATVPYRPA